MPEHTKGMLLVALGQCEICERPEPATHHVHRVWHDGTLDADLKVCQYHSMSDHSDPPMWKMYNRLSDAQRAAKGLQLWESQP